MSTPALLRSIVQALDQTQIPYMLTGSLAAAWYGAGRATLDIDLVVELHAGLIAPLLAAVAGPDVYVSADAAREAVEHDWKADLIVRKSRFGTPDRGRVGAAARRLA